MGTTIKDNIFNSNNMTTTSPISGIPQAATGIPQTASSYDIPTGAQHNANSLPPFPPKMNNDTQGRCIAWTCGSIACAIISTVLVCIVLPIIIWLGVTSVMKSDYNDTVNAMNSEFNNAVNGNGFGSFGDDLLDNVSFNGDVN